MSRALAHVVLAGVLGVVAGVLGAPVVMGATFGGWPAIGVAVTILAALASLAATALDRAAGAGRPGSVVRGLVVGGLGTLIAVAGAFAALQADASDLLPVPLRFASAALPFAVLAALQWPGVVRTVTGVLLVVGGGTVLVTSGMRAAEDERAQRVLTEVGTLEHPWVTELDGYRLGPSQVTGSPFIWTALEPVDGPADAELSLFRDRAVDPDESDPCAAFSFYTPAGDNPTTACRRVGDRLWWRSTGSWQELARHDSDVRVGVMAQPGVPLEALEAALSAARPMTDDEYERWLDEGLTPGW